MWHMILKAVLYTTLKKIVILNLIQDPSYKRMDSVSPVLRSRYCEGRKYGMTSYVPLALAVPVVEDGEELFGAPISVKEGLAW